MQQKQCQSPAKKSNRRPLNEDGSIPQCLVCGKDALKHFNRQRWHLTCGKKTCSESLRLSGMKTTKASSEYAQTARNAAFKTAETKRKIIIDGVTLMEKTAAKIREANLTVDQDGLSGYEKAARKAIPKVRESNERNGHWNRLEDMPAYLVYRMKVKNQETKWVEQISLLENSDKRGLSGMMGAHHLDHKLSCKDGFQQGVPPEFVGHICNLRFVPWEQNLSKSGKSDITLEELLESIKQYEANL